MKTRLLVQTGLLCGMLPFLLAAAPVRVVEGPAVLPNVSEEQRTAAYWISRLAEPDRRLGDAESLAAREQQWLSGQTLVNIWSLPETVSRAQLRGWLTADFSYLERVGQYAEDGRRLDKTDYAGIKKNVNSNDLAGSNPCGWGLTVRRTALQLFPTEKIITAKPRDVEFNMVLHSGLRLAEPLALHHVSRDGLWLFVSSQVGRGWVKATDTGRAGDRSSLRAQVETEAYLVMTAEARFQKPAGQILPDTGRMGCQLPVSGAGKGQLDFPRRRADGSLYFIQVTPMDDRSVRRGPLANTPRNIIAQAFLLLDQEYGWGGGSGYGDCSELIRRVGLSCGLNLPRSTSGLRRALPGQDLPRGRAAKSGVLNSLRGGESLLYLPGHIMLVLGQESGRSYVIHNLYGIHDQDREGEFIRRLARVVVSDLSLGKGSRKGSLRQRCERVISLGTGLDK